MVRLKIIKKNDEEYKLINDTNKEYELQIHFLDIKEIPNVGDYINISAELLNKEYIEYTSSFIFGDLENICGKTNIELTDIDVIKLEIKGKEIYLKRIYG